MKIGIVLPDLRGGGAERVAVNLASGFVNRGYAVDMILLSAHGEFLSDLHPDVNVVDLASGRIRWVFFPLIKYLRQARPAAVLACMWPLTISVLLARIFSCVSTRVLVAEHTTWSRSELLSRPTVGWQIRNSMHWVFPAADAIVAASKGAAADLAQFARLDSKRITTIYNPIVGPASLPSKEPLEPLGWWAGSHLKVLAVGTLKAIKDYETLLNAFSLLRQRMDVRLLILGEGECRLALEAQIRQLSLEASVFMPGFAKNPSHYYMQADLHVLSSIGEGLPTVIVEALNAGTPVVSTDCPSGPREILCDGQFGLLVPMKDPQALANAMEQALLSKHDEAVLKARAQDFSIDKAVDRYLELLLPDSTDGKTV